jgi:hypothetical protein
MTSHPDRAHGYTTTTEASDALTGSRRRKPGPFRQTGCRRNMINEAAKYERFGVGADSRLVDL